MEDLTKFWIHRMFWNTENVPTVVLLSFLRGSNRKWIFRAHLFLSRVIPELIAVLETLIFISKWGRARLESLGHLRLWASDRNQLMGCTQQWGQIGFLQKAAVSRPEKKILLVFSNGSVKVQYETRCYCYELSFFISVCLFTPVYSIFLLTHDSSQKPKCHSWLSFLSQFISNPS